LSNTALPDSQDRLRELAVAAWHRRPLPRPPMTELQASQFAFDWPFLFGRPVCNLCSRGVRRGRTTGHLNAHHPGWLDEWNAALREQGVVA
jgi:hypothetical protein